jgi:hypothetical protein
MERKEVSRRSILGLSPGEYDAAASQYSKNAIFLWCASGLIYIWLSSDHQLLSLVTVLLFLPGIFVASFASIPFFFVSTKLKARVALVQARPAARAVLTLGGTTILLTAFTAVQVVLPIVFVMLCARFL